MSADHPRSSPAGGTARSAGAGRPLRVHAVIDSLTWGGAELLLADLAAAAPKAGLDLTVSHLLDVDGNPAARRLRAVGVDPASLSAAGLRPASVRRVRDELRRIRPDVVHTHLGHADFVGGWAARSLRLPCVSTVHLAQGREPGVVRERVKARIFAATRRHCMAQVITVSDHTRRRYLEAGWDDAERVVVVHNGVVGAAQPGAGRRIRSEFGWGSEHLVVAMVSVLRHGKGHDVAVDAVGRLRSRYPGLRLLVAGEGPARPEIEKLVSPLGDGAVLTGHRDDVMALLDAVDVLVHPSGFDAFPTSLLEAMAAGAPIVATAVGGIPEIVVPGETGVLIGSQPSGAALAEAVGALLEDRGERQRLGAGGRARFERCFTADRWAARLRRVYEAAIASS